MATGWWRSPLGLTATQNWVSGLHRRGFPESGTGPDFRMAGREWPAADGWGVRIAQIAAFASGGRSTWRPSPRPSSWGGARLPR
ncbi:hypothetical protein ACFQZC_23415 [Streptacidiphilus monticola]